MTFMRNARIDRNQPEIVKAFRDLGWSVLIVSQLKKCCDIFVSKGGKTIAVEIKDGSKPPSQTKLTEGEMKFRSEWQGKYALIKSVEDVITLNQC